MPYPTSLVLKSFYSIILIEEYPQIDLGCLLVSVYLKEEGVLAWRRLHCPR